MSIDVNAVTILEHIKVDPHTSIRTVSADTGFSKSSIHRIIKKHNYHPYRMSTVQHLRETDSERRLHFIAWLMISYEDNPEILNYILWTDECKFCNNGVINRHNNYLWSKDNPHWFTENIIFNRKLW